MFYREENNGDWSIAKRVLLPTNPPTEINENNRENDYGWVWHSTPPQDYTDWLETQEEL